MQRPVNDPKTIFHTFSKRFRAFSQTIEASPRQASAAAVLTLPPQLACTPAKQARTRHVHAEAQSERAARRSRHARARIRAIIPAPNSIGVHSLTARRGPGPGRQKRRRLNITPPTLPNSIPFHCQPLLYQLTAAVNSDQ